MKQPDSNRSTDEFKSLYWLLGVFVVYVAVRLLTWRNTVLLEDLDSLGNIRWIKVFQTFDFDQIIDIDPDFTPFYLFFSSIFSLLIGSVEMGARLSSFLFSIVLFFSLAGIGKHLARPCETIAGLVLLSFSAALIPLSFALLTEPSYISTIILGMWLFWRQYKNPSLGNAILLGVVFGLSFLNRLEGIIFLAIIPFYQALHFFFAKERTYNFRFLSAWAAVYIVIFSAVVAPQIWRVSNIVGDFALNGRQVWNIIINEADGRPYEEKIHGLDYSPSERNIVYLKRHPEAWKEITSSFDPKDYIDAFIFNLKDLKRKRWEVLIGYIGTIFFILGLVALYRRNQALDLVMIMIFIGACLVPPLLHSVWIRHIAVIAPLILLVAGIGIVYAARLVSGYATQGKLSVLLTSIVFLSMTVGASAVQLRDVVFRPPTFNKEYSPQEIAEPVRIVRKIVDTELHREAVVAANRGYISHYADARQVYLPYADLDALLKYNKLNNIDFIYLQERRLKRHPFFQQYQEQGLPGNYQLLYSGQDAQGETVKLYRVLKEE